MTVAEGAAEDYRRDTPCYGVCLRTPVGSARPGTYRRRTGTIGWSLGIDRGRECWADSPSHIYGVPSASLLNAAPARRYA